MTAVPFHLSFPAAHFPAAGGYQEGRSQSTQPSENACGYGGHHTQGTVPEKETGAAAKECEGNISNLQDVLGPPASVQELAQWFLCAPFKPGYSMMLWLHEIVSQQPSFWRTRKVSKPSIWNLLGEQTFDVFPCYTEDKENTTLLSTSTIANLEK